jgi:uncharacterized membrane protein YsdA (DUF1294 family)
MEILILAAIAAATLPAMLFQTISNKSIQWIFLGLFLAIAFGYLFSVPILENGSVSLGETAMTRSQIIPIGIGFLCALNFIVVPFLYWIDKRHANINRQARSKKERVGRVPEPAMHALSAVGGAIGAFTSQQMFHHKRSKSSFQLVFFGTILTSIAIYYSLWVVLEPDMARFDAWFQKSSIFKDLNIFNK